MQTPIADFVAQYAAASPIRLHMPGHKGLGDAALDITEVTGADSLYEASGIIKESEDNATALFGAPTFYSTEGSSLCIRAMLYLVALHARSRGHRPRILAGRNVHKSFVSAVALLDIAVSWLYPRAEEAYLSWTVTPSELRARFLAEGAPDALYLTTPDYLGHRLPLREIAAVCHAAGVLLLVDNAHGAYLRFLPTSRHPIDEGADLCCDSAHKTLPALTGAAYLHIAPHAPAEMTAGARTALSLFGSTSPSYLILASLDRLNRYLADGYREALAAFVPRMAALKARLTRHGYCLLGDEPLKLTIAPRAYGYTGEELSEILSLRGIVCELADPDHLVCMMTPDVTEAELSLLLSILLSLPRRPSLAPLGVPFAPPAVRMSPREAILQPSELLPSDACLGRVLAAVTVACPPAVPLLVSGEVVDERALSLFSYYGIRSLRVVRECEPDRKEEKNEA